jgi:hypothetical protein
MNKPKLAALGLLLISALAVRAGAQTLEIGAGLGAARVEGASDWWGRAVRSPALDGTIGFAFNDRFAIESFLTYGRRSVSVAEYAPLVAGGDTHITEGLYGVVVRQRVLGSPASGFHAFVSYGLGGMYSRQSVPARQYINGRTVMTLPAYTDNETQGLWSPIGGFGVQQAIASHLAVRAEGQVVTFFGIPIGGRGSVGVVVPIGGRAK